MEDHSQGKRPLVNQPRRKHLDHEPESDRFSDWQHHPCVHLLRFQFIKPLTLFQQSHHLLSGGFSYDYTQCVNSILDSCLHSPSDIVDSASRHARALVAGTKKTIHPSGLTTRRSHAYHTADQPDKQPQRRPTQHLHTRIHTQTVAV